MGQEEERELKTLISCAQGTQETGTSKTKHVTGKEKVKNNAIRTKMPPNQQAKLNTMNLNTSLRMEQTKKQKIIIIIILIIIMS